ncbi:Bug family tripartite tricarboxylate transporter substrate binding protein [Bordetella tumulicola]|uniref:Bug family tripartite tricarboxylate transporter substrate binding protein n=1 Tax=Bordetella tumulicola TaxID=1649133 RepID=UPI0039EE7888
MKTYKNALTAIAAMTFAASVHAAYPDKPIKLIVPFAPGGPTDIVARSLADALSKVMDNTIIVENKPGAGGGIGTAQVVRAKPDGYTLGVAAVSTHVVNPVCNSNTGYDPVNDFTPISLVADMPMIWVMQPKMPEKDFKEIIQTAKNSPGKLTQGTPGMCSLGHMIIAKINHRLGINIESIPYQGSAPAMNDFMGQNLDLMLDVDYLVQPLVLSGRAKPFAVMWPERLSTLPNVPTFAELGYKELNMRPWYGLVGPKGLSPEITQKLMAAVHTAMESPKLREQFKTAGMVPIADVEGNAFAEKIRSEYLDTKAFAQASKMAKQ